MPLSRTAEEEVTVLRVELSAAKQGLEIERERAARDKSDLEVGYSEPIVSR